MFDVQLQAYFNAGINAFSATAGFCWAAIVVFCIFVFICVVCKSIAEAIVAMIKRIGEKK